MNAEQFEQRAALDQDLADYLDEVSQEANSGKDRSMTILFAVAAFALYRMAKNHYDHQRGLAEAELRQVMLDQVDALVQKGWERDKALEAVGKVSQDVASLRPDSPTLKTALALLKAGNTAQDG